MNHIDTMKQARAALAWASDRIDPEGLTECECPLCKADDALRLAIELAEKQEPCEYCKRGLKAMCLCNTAPPQRQHITDGSHCWCNPETTYTDPETGASVIVHKDPQ